MFKIARRPGIAWINALRREQRRRRWATGDGQVQVAVSLRALLQLEDAEFVRKAYIKLLGRRPDPSGHATYLAMLRGKLSDRIKVLEILSDSSEGRARNARVAGLRLAIWWSRIFGFDANAWDLLRYDGAGFVDQVYASLLRREPDDSGYAGHVAEARRGRAGKINVLAGVATSQEARDKRLRIRGLRFAILLQRIYENIGAVRHRARHLVGVASRGDGQMPDVTPPAALRAGNDDCGLALAETDGVSGKLSRVVVETERSEA